MNRYLGGVSAFALMLGLASGPALAEGVLEDATANAAGGAATGAPEASLGAATAQAESANVTVQDANQSITGTDNIDGDYDATLDFDDGTFQEQTLDSNNFNSGQNGAQQNGVAFGVNVGEDNDLVDDDVISVNVLSQRARQKIETSDDNINEGAEYKAKMEFDSDTFKDQVGVANNFNSGQNGAQQGGVAFSILADGVENGASEAEVDNVSANNTQADIEDVEANAIAANSQWQRAQQKIKTTNDGSDNVNGTYDARMDFDNETFENQTTTSNNFNSGQNGAQQNGVAMAVSASSGESGDVFDTSVAAVNALSQSLDQDIDVQDDNIGEAAGETYNGEMDFGSQTFKDHVAVGNNFNSGQNAGQQGGVAFAVRAEDEVVAIADDAATLDTVDANNSSASIKETDATVVGANVQRQNVDQQIKSDDKGGDNVDADYKARMDFGSQTFEEQTITSNNFNSGQNGAQQNGVAFGVSAGQTDNDFDTDFVDGATAAAVNVLSQSATQDIDVDDDNIGEVTGDTYDARMDFGSDTFEDQVGAANNFNTGQNAAQQGGVAFAVNAEEFVADTGDDAQISTIDATSSLASADEVDADAVGLNVQRQDADQRIRSRDTSGNNVDARYNAQMTFEGETFQDQTITSNNFNTGQNAAQQNGVSSAFGVGDTGSNEAGELGDDTSVAAINVLSQSAKQRIDTPGDNIGSNSPKYNAVMDFGFASFSEQVGVANNFNTGQNAAQQGGVAFTAETDSFDTAGESGEADLDSVTVNTSMAQISDAEAGAIGANVQFQGANQTIDNTNGGAGDNIDGPYDAEMKFGDDTFRDQVITSNNFNTGQNAAQQNGVAFGVGVFDDGLDLGGSANVVAVNALSQVAAQTIVVQQSVVEGGGYNAKMDFGNNTFRNQVGVANNFNTGMNAAQQGAVAIAVWSGGFNGGDN